jgi:hypothetical protein
VRTFVILLILIAGAVPADAAESCESGKWGPLVSSKSIPLAPAIFDEIRGTMTMWEILRLLGPAARDVGSGLTILEWNSTDGRVFRVGGTSLCRVPLYARFGRGPEASTFEFDPTALRLPVPRMAGPA